MNEESSESSDNQPFIFVVCQNGAQAATKLELMTSHPNLRLAFSRPGFITFKVLPNSESGKPGLPERFSLKSALSRTAGWSLGKTTSDDANELVTQICQVPELAESKHLHIWQRDPVVPGKNGFEPGISPLAGEIGTIFLDQSVIQENSIAINRVAKPDERIFDVVLVEPNEWWYGYHFATNVAARWPGGTPKFETNTEVYSRAYFKLKEALLWSGISISPGDVCAEIGSSPGGACQLLLEMEAQVIGIDPAEMEPGVLEHERFFHIRKRGNEVRKREFQDVKWLMADLNTSPNFTLEMIGEIVSHPTVDIKGMVLTLKLSDWNAVNEIPTMLTQVKDLGFQVVKARQLAFNRREFCLVAVKDRFVLRSGKKKA